MNSAPYSTLNKIIKNKLFYFFPFMSSVFLWPSETHFCQVRRVIIGLLGGYSQTGIFKASDHYPKLVELQNGGNISDLIQSDQLYNYNTIDSTILAM